MSEKFPEEHPFVYRGMQEFENSNIFGEQKIQPPTRMPISRRHLIITVVSTAAGSLAIEHGATLLWKAISDAQSKQCASHIGSRTWPVVSYDVHSKRNDPDIVRVVQYMLQTRDYDIGPDGVDGVFGKNTLAAVHAFQENTHLDENGKLDTPTWEHLILISQNPNQGGQILALHERLAIWNISPFLKGMRVFNEQTEDAVRTFQQQHQPPLTVNGQADLDTWCLLVGGKISHCDQ